MRKLWVGILPTMLLCVLLTAGCKPREHTPKEVLRVGTNEKTAPDKEAEPERTEPTPTETPVTRTDVKGQDTPKDAIVKMDAALIAGDKSALLECFDATPKQRPYLEAMAEYSAANRALDKAHRKAFGEKTSKKTEADDERSLGLSKEAGDNIQVVVTGETATAVVPGYKGDVHLVRKMGVWKVVPTNVAPPPDRLPEETMRLKLQAAATRTVVTEIENGDVEEQDIAEHLFKALKAELRKLRPKPE